MIAVDNLDEVIALIRKSKTPKERSMERFALDDLQSQSHSDLRLQRLTGLEIEILRKEYADLLKLIGKLEAILADEKKLMKVVKDELREIAQSMATTAARASNILQGCAAVEEEHVAELATVTFTRWAICGACIRNSIRNFPRYVWKTTNLTTCPVAF